MKKINLLVSLCVLLFVSSCCHKSTVVCTSGWLGVHVVGSFQTGTPLVIRYSPDNAFDVVIDTLVGSLVPTVGTDSAFLTFRSLDSTLPNAYMATDSFGEGLLLAYDYKIIFPEDTLTWSITNLNPTGPAQTEMTQCGGGKAPSRCTRSAASCTLNGTTITTISYPNTSTYQPFNYINLAR